MGKIIIEANDVDELKAMMAKLCGSTTFAYGSAGTPPSMSATPPMPTNTNPVATTNDDDDNNAPASDGSGLDAKGLPWDERIHSKNKGRNADGTWRQKRGVADIAIAQVEAELRQRVAAMTAANQGQQPTNIPQMPVSQPVMQQPTMQPMQPPIMQQPMMMPPQQPVQQPQPMPNYQVPQQPNAMAAGVTPHPLTSDPAAWSMAHMVMPMDGSQPAGPVMDFPTLMQHVANGMRDDRPGQPGVRYIPGELLAQICAGFGFEKGISDLSANPHYINKFIVELIRNGAWKA